MEVWGTDILESLCNEQHRAQRPLASWLTRVKEASWRTFLDIRRTFNHADTFRGPSGTDYVIFDVGGNKYRVIAYVNYAKQRVTVVRALTHSEYDREKWKDQL